MVKVTGTLQKSTEIMKLSNSLIKLPQISQAMREMSREMTKVSYACALSLSASTDMDLGWRYGRDDGRGLRRR